MSIEAIDHLYVETPDFETACAFWQGLGFTMVEQWHDDDHRAGRLESGSAYIVLAEAEQPSLTVHFRITNAVAYAEQAAKHDAVTLQLPLEATHWGSQWMRVKDPDNHVFALEEPGC